MTQRSRKTVLLLISLVITSLYLFPYLWMVLTGIRQPIDTITMPPRLFFTPTLDGFIYLFNTTQFQYFLINSAIVSVTSTVLVIAIAAPAAYALAQLPIRGRAFLLGIMIARMVPGIVIVIPAYLLAVRTEQLDTYQVLILFYVAFNLPFAIWLMRSFFNEIHPSIREAAIIDGASEIQVFRLVHLPLSSSGVVATSVFVFIAAWNEFLFALVLTNSQAATAPLAMLGFRTQWGIQWGQIGAAAILVSTPVLVFTLIMQKYLLRGLTMGAVK